MKLIRDEQGAVERWISDLEAARRSTDRSSRAQAGRIIDAVRRNGDEAVSRFLRTLDGVVIPAGELCAEVGPGEISDPALRAAVDLAIERVTRFHAKQSAEGYRIEDDGSVLEHIVRPLRRVGIYVPGGRAVYLSTLIMCAVPARLAGVPDLVVATTPAVAARSEFRYVCGLFGIRSVYRAGGPAGIAALALGTSSLPRADKIVGPGNRWVAAAKQALYGEVGIDMAAGPSEIVVIADASADARFVAKDMLAQAEHGEDSVAVCLSDSEEFALDLSARLKQECSLDPSLGGRLTVMLLRSIADAATLANRIAPEHLSIVTADARRVAASVPDCGAVFLGASSPVALGDYVAGTNHVLPTGATARFGSPLGVYDFYKRASIVSLSSTTSNAIADAGSSLASFEGLHAHARSIDARKAVV